MRTILDVKNLYKDSILVDVSFQVEEGEMVAIMGPSGSGKSTLLYQVSGMDRFTSGQVLLNNIAIDQLTEDELAKLRLTRMGFVFQQMNMLKVLSIKDNILLPSFAANKRKDLKVEAEKKALILMEKMGIAELQDKKITEVSGGQLQRACICRSMMNSPEILFADEPTGALNQRATEEVMEEFQKLNQENTTILMVTHDSKVAARCDRILYLLDGRIQGELVMGKWSSDTAKDRERKISDWLTEMGW